jgi:hypothetical protein
MDLMVTAQVWVPTLVGFLTA